MRVFVTGSTGLLGSYVLRNAPPNFSLGATYNINKLVPKLNCEYMHVDITNKKLVGSAFNKFKPNYIPRSLIFDRKSIFLLYFFLIILF